jgi:tetratricopeptide (TPR) repeat protein
MNDKSLQEHIWLEEAGRRILNWLNLKKNLDSVVYVNYINQSTKEFVDKYVEYVNLFISDPKSSPFTLGQVSSILKVYAGLELFQVTNSFFSRIDLVKLTERFQKESSYSISALIALILPIHRYLKGLDSIEQQNELIKSILQEIELDLYAKYVNEKISEKWEKASSPEYTYESIETMASVLRTTSDYLLRLSMLTDDEEIRYSAKKKVSSFFSYIDFSRLGKLMETQRKEIGSVRGVVNMLRQQIFDKQTKKLAQEQFLSELDFKRLALSYNNKPIGNSSLANFCNRYSETKETLSVNWEIFFDTIDFQIPFNLACFKGKECEEFFKKFDRHAKKELESFMLEESDSICINISDVQKEELGDEAFSELLKHNRFSFINMNLVCFKKKEYEEFLKKFVPAKKLVPFLTKESDSICINILHARKANLGDEALNELLKHSGFNVTHNTMLFQRLPQVFRYGNPKRNKIFNQFDFKVIGLRAQNKTPKGIEQLLRRINELNVDKFKYRNFFEGLGKQECKRLFHDGCKDLLSTLKKCEFEEIEIKEWVDLEGETDNPQTLIDMAEVVTKSSKDYFKAEFLLKKAVDLCPSNSNARFRWIQALIQIQNLDIALTESRKLVQINESNSEYHNQLANILKEFKKWEEVEEEYRQSLKLSVNNKAKAKYLNNIALLILEKNETTRFDEAIALCEKAIKLNPRFKWTEDTKKKLIQKMSE